MSHCLPWCHRAGGILRLSRPALAGALAAAVTVGVHAQSPVPPSSAASGAAPSERAKRDAEKVFQWIRIHSDKPRKAAAAAPERPVPAAPVKRAAKAPDSPITETLQSTPVVAAPARSEPAPPPVAAAPAPLPPAPSLAATAKAAPMVPPSPAPAAEPDEVLIAIRKTEPEFPGNLMRTLRKGMVQVSFTVQADGSVTEPRVVSTTHPRLAQTAVATVSQWRFQPLRNAQEAVVDLGFNLD
jgi:TonB family protein